MDPFEKDMFEKVKKQRKQKRILLALLVICVLVALTGLYLVLNRVQVVINLKGDSQQTLEYGQKYEEYGAEAIILGRNESLLVDQAEIVIKGQVDESKVGSYTIEYLARWGIWRGSAQRVVHVVDTVAPHILLHSSKSSYTIPGSEYQEEGFMAVDNYDGNITHLVERMEKDGAVYYFVTDSSGNEFEVVRDIVYYDPIAPVLTLTGDEYLVVPAGEIFEDPGYVAMDNSAGDISDRVQVTGDVDVCRLGVYKLRYYVEDFYDNPASAVRTVEVVANQQPKTVKPEGKVIYLTFDDGPGPYTEQLLDILRAYDVKATFFVCNTKYIDLLKVMAEDGHAIGIHSVTHNYHSIYASEDAYFEDLFQMQSIIKEQTGITTTLVRFPGGGSNTVSRFNPGIMTRLADHLWEMGFQYFDWNVDSDDAGGAKNTKNVVRNVTEGVENRAYSIVLQHDTKDFSVEAVEQIILWARENGFEFRPLEPSSPTCHHGINN